MIGKTFVNISTKQTCFIIVVSIVCILIYYPGLFSSFELDSNKLFGLYETYLEKKENINLFELSFSYDYGRSLSQLSFYIHFLIEKDINPFSIKATNLTLHLINGWLVWLLSFKFAAHTTYFKQSKLWIANLTFILWLFSPINMSSVLYAIQRMNQLATFFSLVSLISYVYLRELHTKVKAPHILNVLLVVILIISLILGLLSKENAILVPLFICLVEVSFFQKSTILNNITKTKALVAMLVVLLTFTLFPINDILNYQARTFSLYERFITEFRVIWIYLSEIILPRSIATGMYHDGFIVSTGILNPITTIFSLISLICITIFSIRYLRHIKLQLMAFGFCFFMTGHLLESTILPLEIFFEHRNYLPSFGIYLSIAAITYSITKKLNPHLRKVIIGLYILLFVYIGHTKAIIWTNSIASYTLALDRSYPSARAASNLAQIYLEQGKYEESKQLLNDIANTRQDRALQANLQILFINCATKIITPITHYKKFQNVTTRESNIEISQSLENILRLKQATSCDAIDNLLLIDSIESIANTYRMEGKDNWHINYYLAQFYILNNAPQSAISLLKREAFLGEQKAEIYLKELLKQIPQHD